MFDFKKWFAGLVGLSLFVCSLATLMPLTGRGQGQAQGPFAPRKFYVTQTTHDGSQALSACANGYHMASLWEIFDTSNLRYDAQRGLTTADAGFGPPSNSIGWIRTGFTASELSHPGVANCNAWTSDSNSALGTLVHLPDIWDSPNVTAITPWSSIFASCSNTQRVWCVQD